MDAHRRHAGICCDEGVPVSDEDSIRCPLCKRPTVAILHGQYADGTPDGTRFLAHHQMKMSGGVWSLRCPLGGAIAERVTT